MEMLSEFIAIPAIAVIVYLIAEGYKLIANGREQFLKVIPVICGFMGAILSVVAFFTTPDMIPAENLFAAIAIGIVSGLAATGAHQVFKQFKE